MVSRDELSTTKLHDCGILAPVCTFSFISPAIQSYPPFSRSGNALSDLGVGGLSAQLFSSGLIIGGRPCGRVCEWPWPEPSDFDWGRVGRVFLYGAGVAPSSIGIFPETFGAVHSYFSVAFFALVPLSLFVNGAAMVGDPRIRFYGLSSLLLWEMATIAWTLQYGGMVISETVAGLAIPSWSIMMDSRLIRGEPEVLTGVVTDSSHVETGP